MELWKKFVIEWPVFRRKTGSSERRGEGLWKAYKHLSRAFCEIGTTQKTAHHRSIMRTRHLWSEQYPPQLQLWPQLQVAYNTFAVKGGSMWTRQQVSHSRP